MSSTQNPSSFEKQVVAMLKGFREHFPVSNREVIIGGQTMTLAQVHERLTQIWDALATVRHSLQAHRRAIAARDASMRSSRGFYEDGVLFVRHSFGRESNRLVSFGIAQPKPRRVLNSQEKAIAKAKAAATRMLRGTKGKKQRAAITLTAQPTLQVFGPDGKLLPGQGPAAEPKTPELGEDPGPSGAG